SISPLPLATKPKKWKSQTVTLTLPKSQVPEIPGAPSKKSKRPKSKKSPTKTKATPPKPTEGSKQSHLVSSGTIPDPQDLERNIQLASMRLPSTLDEGTHKSKNNLCPRVQILIPKTQWETNNPLIWDCLPRLLMKVRLKPHRVDETQSTRLRYRSPTKNKGKTSSGVEPDTEPLQLQTFADVQAFLLSEDELDKESDMREGWGGGLLREDMDEDP
ncbi:hypothetical protein Tco_0101294, partial [Tanacetum coccineum]